MKTLREKLMDERNHLEWLRHSEFWSYWPVQTVKRRRPQGEWPECGLVIAADYEGECIPIVHDVLLPLAGELANPHKEFKYDSIEDMLADGWEVD